MKKQILFTLFIAAVGVSNVWAKTNHDPAWFISKPRVYLPTPGAKATAGYLELTNKSKKSITVELKEMKPFKHVEMHETVKENEQAKMIQVDRFEVLPDTKLELVPGGKHLMLFEPQKPLKVGQKLKGVLKLNDKTSVIEFEVIPRETQTTEEHHHH